MEIQCFVFFNSGLPQAQETCYLNVLYFVGDMALFWGYVERSQHRTIMTGSRHEEEVVWARGLQSGLQCNCRVHKADKQLISYMRFSAKTLAVMRCVCDQTFYIILSTLGFQRIYCKQPQKDTHMLVSHCTGSWLALAGEIIPTKGVLDKKRIFVLMQSTVWTWIQTEGIIVLLQAAVSAVLVELQRLIWKGSRLSFMTKGSYRRVTPGAVIRPADWLGTWTGTSC